MKAKRLFSMVLAGAAAVVLGACGESEWTGEDARTTTLGIDRDGHVLEVVVEDFNASYYSIEGLRASMESEIAQYIADIGEESAETPPIVLNGVRQDGAQVHTETTYQTAEDYGEFTLEPLYYGTLRQARLRGYELPSVLTDAEGGSYPVGDDDTDNHVVFTDGHDHIVTPYKIIACTAGVRLVSDREADFSGTEGRAAVLLEK